MVALSVTVPGLDPWPGKHHEASYHEVSNIHRVSDHYVLQVMIKMATTDDEVDYFTT